nr:sulfatase-like hydrolase/transferase [Verrucomicrobiota bacterium]
MLPVKRQLNNITILLTFFSVFAIPLMATPPNIIVIMADDLGYGDLSSYGAKDLQSPHIDQLVKRGLKFTEFYANCPVCSPTRASFISGRYPELVGVPGVIRTHPANNWGELTLGIPTVASQLQAVGYQTALIGKWHLGLSEPHWPNNRGFDFFHGWLGDMMDDYYTHRRHGINYMRHNTDV